LFFRLTLDSSTELLFGESVKSQLESTDGEDAFAHAFDNAQHYSALRGRLGYFYWTYNPKEMQDSVKYIHNFVDRYVKPALDSTTKVKGIQDKDDSKYVFSEAIAQQTNDPVEIRSQLLNILLAGRDTTASLLSYVFRHLVRHPQVLAKLRKTILNDFGDYENPRDISFATLKSCTYLQHVINETLRLTTIVPINFRNATRDTTLPRGGGPDGSKPIFVRKGQVVEYSIHVLHRRKDIWGDDAEEFKPERWQGRRPGWEFLPFNGGPRICIGQQLALTTASYVVVRLLQRFERVEGTAEELSAPELHNLTLTACPHQGPFVSLTKAAA